MKLLGEYTFTRRINERNCQTFIVKNIKSAQPLFPVVYQSPKRAQQFL